jgi:hypothetical protein
MDEQQVQNSIRRTCNTGGLHHAIKIDALAVVATFPFYGGNSRLRQANGPIGRPPGHVRRSRPQPQSQRQHQDPPKASRMEYRFSAAAAPDYPLTRIPCRAETTRLTGNQLIDILRWWVEANRTKHPDIDAAPPAAALPTPWRNSFPARTRMARARNGIHKKCFAVKRKASTDPDMANTTAMLSGACVAVDSTIEKRPVAGAAGLGRPELDFDRFLAAMLSPSGVRLHTRPDP